MERVPKGISGGGTPYPPIRVVPLETVVVDKIESFFALGLCYLNSLHPQKRLVRHSTLGQDVFISNFAMFHPKLI